MITEKETATEEGAQIKKTDELEGINIVCSKHGIINNGAFYIRYSTIQNDEKKTAFDNHNLFCVACLNELYMKFQKEGIIGQVSVSMKYKDSEESKDVPLENVDISQE